ncbi:helix-turn-helix domain-containing protein [Exiguobacterium sp. s78]|uniref:helix-turn-helix domain-containing protein n=1 Tax=Exiguobacterium sp. s78 TaxID=2751197 RepID=UPI001BE7381D|nr:helix-turn-helix domain-containing protein [Exiguobacterium sp. s78]
MAKQRIDVVLDNDTIKSYINHESVDQLNESYWEHLNLNGDLLTKTEKELFFRLSQYAVKHYGVAYISMNTLASKVGCSRQTVLRAYKKFTSLSMIEVFHAKRKSDNRQTSNIVRFVKKLKETKTENMVSEIKDNVAEDVTQETGQNVTPTSSSLSSSSKSLDLKTFDTPNVQIENPIIAFEGNEDLHRALLPLALSERKKVELLNTAGTRSLHNTLVSMLIQEFPVIMRNFDVLKHLKLVKSAVSRTVFVSKQREVKNLLGYFVKTLGNLLREEFKSMIVDFVYEDVLQAIEEKEFCDIVCEEKSTLWTPVWRHEVYHRVMDLVSVQYRAV